MIMEKLQLKDIASYLPYGLKCNAAGEWIDNDDPQSGPKILTVSGTFTDSYGERYIEAMYGGDKYEIFNTDFFPILRPMSDLVKEIDGVVPIVELFKLYDSGSFGGENSIKRDPFPIIDYKWEYYPTINKDECILRYLIKFQEGDRIHSFRYDPQLRRFSCYDDTYKRPLGVAYQADLFEYLSAHHFDYRGLIEKGLAIDVNTLKNE